MSGGQIDVESIEERLPCVEAAAPARSAHHDGTDVFCLGRGSEHCYREGSRDDGENLAHDTSSA
jgi:hypothetical protein